QQQARLRPDCRVVALNWGPWEGGMVTPALQKLFQQEGVGLIPLEAGVNFLVRELCARDTQAVEVVVLGASPKPAHATSRLTLAFERKLTLDEYPVLRSHVIDGRAVLPMALSAEWLAQGALHLNPGLVVQGFNELRILRGVFLDEGETVPL